MKENALKDIKKASVLIAIEAVKNLIENSIDKNKVENYYNKSLQQAKTAIKQTKIQNIYCCKTDLRDFTA